jgi:hypothetical protein
MIHASLGRLELTSSVRAETSICTAAGRNATAEGRFSDLPFGGWQAHVAPAGVGMNLSGELAKRKLTSYVQHLS